MIYIGSNIFPDDDPSTVTYYFQDTLSYFACGSALDPRANDAHPEIEVRLFPHAPAELGSGIGDLDMAIAALLDARSRSERQ